MFRFTTVALVLSTVVVAPAFASEQLASGTQSGQVAALSQANAAIVQRRRAMALFMQRE